jgi:pimeloyl-ACP methyl ester carboxylesterase
MLHHGTYELLYLKCAKYRYNSKRKNGTATSTKKEASMSILRRSPFGLIARTVFLAFSIVIITAGCSGYTLPGQQASSPRPTVTVVPTNAPAWEPKVKYGEGAWVRYKNVTYLSLHDHTSQTDYPPNITPLLWLDESPVGPVAWQAGNVTYKQGDEVTYNGVTYKAIRTSTSQDSANPASTPALWQSLSTPRFEDASCPMNLTGPNMFLKYVEGHNINCGYLVVRENPQVQSSPEIHLAVAIVKSSSQHPSTDPLVMLNGGPGGSLLDEFDFFVSAGGIKSQVGNRDVILLDQRGAGFSEPSLACTEEYAFNDAQIEKPDNEQGLSAVYRQCDQRFLQDHIDESQYNVYNNASDVHDLITALKLQQVDIYGVSYGTRVALEVMRSFPQNVRSVILDSTVPSDLGFFATIPHDYARVYQVFFQQCTANTTCARKYPNLAARFYAFLAAANKHPITMPLTNPQTGKVYPKAFFQGYDLFQAFWQFFYVTSFIPYLPGLMNEVINGHYDRFAAVYSQLDFDTSVNIGVYEATMCSMEEGRTTNADIQKTAQELDPAIRAQAINDTTLMAFNLCKVWNVPVAATSERQPVVSSIPTLIMEGENDPITPPTNGNSVATHLSKSYVTLFPATGHGTYLSSQTCPVEVAQSFLDQPDQRPNTTCIQSMQEPNFQ